MGIYCNNFYTTTLSQGQDIYANTIAASNLSNVSIQSDLRVDGDIYSTGRMDGATTVFARFRLGSNQSFAGSNEFFATSNLLAMDLTSTNMNGMDTMDRIIPNHQVYNQSNGVISVPVNGLYYIEVQGAFSNVDPAAKNGVYLRFLNHTYPTSRVASVITSSPLVSTNHVAYLLGGDRFQPTFYSSDSNATLLASNGETYVSFAVLGTVTPTASNFTRLP